MTSDKLLFDTQGIPFEFPPYILSDKEYSKIVHEINNVYHSKYINKPYAMHRSIDLHGIYSIYFFENHGYGDYNIVEKFFD